MVQHFQLRPRSSENYFSLMWSNLARWPEWQKRIQNEIDNSEMTSIEKWEHLPLTAAFFYETWRWLPSHHRSLFHSATKVRYE